MGLQQQYIENAVYFLNIYTFNDIILVELVSIVFF